MQPTSGTTISIWAATADTPSEATVQENFETDVCISGAGIAGLKTAFLLVKEGEGRRRTRRWTNRRRNDGSN